VVGQIVPVNPASSVRGPKLIVRKGKAIVLEPAELQSYNPVLNLAQNLRITPAGSRKSRTRKPGR